MLSMKTATILSIACGVLSLAIVQFSYWLNIQAGIDMEPAAQCNPYIEGCVSTSGAVRGGPGLISFKAVMLPVSVLMMMTWAASRRWTVAGERGAWRYAGVTRTIGMVGALALIIYVVWLGTDGVIYGWLRRYGATVFFGCTALAQLMFARTAMGLKPGSGGAAVNALAMVVGLEWLIGMAYVSKRLFVENEAVIFRVENILEWWFVLAMSAGFILMGLVFSHDWQGTRGNQRRHIGGG